MVLLRNELGFEHHITTAYSAWSNGSVERMNKELLALCRKVHSGKRIKKRRWPEAIPLINYAVNHAPSPLLGGKSPIEVAFGYTPKTPVELAMFRGVKYSGTMVAASQDVFGLQIYKKTSADNVEIETIPFADFLDGKLALLQDALAELHRVAFVRQTSARCSKRPVASTTACRKRRSVPSSWWGDVRRSAIRSKSTGRDRTSLLASSPTMRTR
jgi:hypothetical protein